MGRFYRYSDDPNKINVDQLDAHFDPIRVASNRLYLDGLALIEVADWLRNEKPDASFIAFGRAFFRLFPGSAFVSDVARAALRVAAGLEHTAIGEDSYFCREVRKAHPLEFDMLRAAWAKRLLVVP